MVAIEGVELSKAKFGVVGELWTQSILTKSAVYFTVAKSEQFKT